MKRSTTILSLALGLAALGATGLGAAPAQAPWDITTTTIHADTLARGFAADSAIYTQAINVFGARAIVVDAITSGAGSVTADTLSVGNPIFDTCGTGTFTGNGGLSSMVGIEPSAVGAVPAHGSFIYLFYGTGDGTAGAGGTPIPTTTRAIKMKLKGGNARRYDSANSATLAPTGTITIRIHVMR